MAMTRFDPFTELVRMREAMADMMTDRFWRFLPFTNEEHLFPLDVQETGDTYIIEASLPGMKPEDLTVTATGNTITIRAHYTLDVDGDRKTKYLRKERVQGNMYREVTLPSEIDPEKVASSFEHGVLKLTLPKTPATKQRAIHIAVKEPVAIGATADRK